MRYRTEKLLLIILITFLHTSCSKENAPFTSTVPGSPLDYKQEMREFIQGISQYAKKRKTNFIVIPQNGVEIISATGEDTNSPAMNYINAIDGIGQESLLYGYYKDNQKTPSEERAWISTFLDMAKNKGEGTVLITDYCHAKAHMDDSYDQNSKKGYISFAATHRELDNIPTHPSPINNENADVITELSEVKNFLYLINPQAFSTRQELVNAISNTNYDLVIIDFFFQGEKYTPAQIAQLKEKNNGGKRLLVSYMSIGEAEDYRYYWEETWHTKPPKWLDQENTNWPGNHKVEYWHPAWQKIIYGNETAYLDKILNANFDGVYLDIIDAFEYFEIKGQK